MMYKVSTNILEKNNLDSSSYPRDESSLDLIFANGEVKSFLNNNIENDHLLSHSPVVEEANIINKIQSSKENEKIQVLAEWEGCVLSIGAENFTAKMKDLIDPDAPAEIAEFDFSDLQDGDIELVKLGGLFRWLIGRTKSKKGMVSKISRLHFRRLPTWRPEHFEKAEIESETILNDVFSKKNIEIAI